MLGRLKHQVQPIRDQRAATITVMKGLMPGAASSTGLLQVLHLDFSKVSYADFFFVFSRHRVPLHTLATMDCFTHLSLVLCNIHAAFL